MNISDLKNEFWELRKSPALIICSIIGWGDIIAWILFICSLFVFSYGFSLYCLFMGWLCIRIPEFKYYMPVILLIFIIEKLCKIKIKFGFFDNNKFYRIFWITGFIGFIITSLLIPSILYGPLKFILIS